MKRLLYLIIFSLYGAVFYSVLNESFSLINLLTGFVTGGLGALIINKGDIINPSFYAIFKYLRLLFKLITGVYISSVKVIIGFFKKQSVCVISVEAEEGVSAVAQANCITLTPGTVTVEKTGKTLKVIKFC